MRGGSLRLRLFLAGLVSLVVALGAALLGLSWLFERHAERQLVAELSAVIDSIAGRLDRTEDGVWSVTPPPNDPRYEQPLSGLYWQVSGADGQPLLRSRSLWDEALPLPGDDLPEGARHEHRITGPGGRTLLAVEQRVVLPPRLGAAAIRVIAARDVEELAQARRDFTRDLVPFLVLIGLLLLAAGAAQLAVGLSPLKEVRRRLAAIRSGGADRMGGGFPDEIRPLAEEVDALLEQRARAVAAAEARAADLAHGLKTPLQLLFGEAGRLAAAGQAESAALLTEAGTAMHRHVERELLRARSNARSHAPPGEGRALVLPVAERLVRVLRRTPDGERLDWQLDIPADLAAAIHPDDLAEALGALAENAARFAARAVRLSARREGSGVRIEVRDDGPGIAPADHAAALRRGGRLDEGGTGSGLGLSIAREIAEAWGGGLGLGPTGPGSMTVALVLPVAG